MAGHFDTQIGIGVKDNASGPLQRIRNETVRMQQARERIGIRSEHTLQREITRTEAAYNRLERSGVLSASELARAHEKTTAAVARLRREMRETERQQERLRRNPLGDARERLGIRSEQSIRREIALTEAAYNRLARSGELSAAEQARAYAHMSDTVSKLRRELGETERTQSRLVSGLKTTLKVGAGAAALTTGVAVALAEPVRQQMDYDSELRRTANFLYRNGDVKTRIQGVKTIDNAVRQANRLGGGHKEDGLMATETMGRSGMGTDEVFSALPEIMKIHTATGADARSLALMRTAAFNYGLKGRTGDAALDALTTASQHGQVDVPLLAKTMPVGLELAKSAGFVGKKGFSNLAALYEVNAAMAGADEGVVNTNNLMMTLSSQTISDNARTVTYHGKKVDWPAMRRKDAEQGHDALYTLTHLVGSIDDSDQTIINARKKLAAARTEAEKDKWNSVINSEHGANVGHFLRDQQSLKGYLAYEKYQSQYQDIATDVNKQFSLPEDHRSTDIDYAVIKDSNKFKSDQAANEKDFATTDMAKVFADAWGVIAEKSTELAKEFPVLAEAISGVSSVFSAVWQQLGGVGTTLATMAGVKLGAKLLKGRTAKTPGGELTPGETINAGKVTGETGEIVGKSATKWGSKLLKPLSGIGDVLMLGGSVYDEFIKRGKDREKDNHIAVPAGTPAPHFVGALDVLDELSAFFSRNSEARQSQKQEISTTDPWDKAPVINVYLDSQLATRQMLHRVEMVNRRHGA
ncbi:phage tail tape measure protein [Salmonella enterica subsp. enterica serovar Kottbus]|nr:phage tail tape measure protein [Salmonella enterica subsp. enterica serovar Kottbus]EBY5039776.1 phage tail tape measure protein [Salmonella enterica subsp. enterica serovar Kottbus]EDA6905854.1 phage tail tape measure protein [Salmonella enterica subsp. enterica serovar Kottbus]EDA8960211.1 phage tail tape measure protein [Salmonella enterica subsp. enterica serovar Kottbus]EDL0055428.1 phage tail tape measure protein [Salmonella enterica subsp. enterica serovar Kottbus]